MIAKRVTRVVLLLLLLFFYFVPIAVGIFTGIGIVRDIGIGIFVLYTPFPCAIVQNVF